MANTPAERTYVFPAVAVLATVCTVAWWRDALPVPSWFGTDPSPWNLGFSYLLASVLHLDALHLVFNLYWVQRWAPPLERRHGALAVVTLLLWLAFGTGGVEWIAGSSGVGLSGLVYGLLGFMWASERL